ncbi:hypothetical protein PEC18_19285 [Paucibacter sp. O1-1]|nr:hypothetical protein [Paucibacter sp. O1-1]MDA3827931.1 hypothetical protein [Paucibacter sp. O1-1]
MPDGQRFTQDKLTLTGFERACGVIEAGDALHVFDTAHGRIGVAICYDSEFPLYARALREAGVRLLVPSCTDTPAGATRVRVGCQARALENQLLWRSRQQRRGGLESGAGYQHGVCRLVCAKRPRAACGRRRGAG